MYHHVKLLRCSYTVLYCIYFSVEILLQCYAVRILKEDLY